MRQRKSLALRALPALMLILLFAACSRTAEPEPEQPSGPEVVVIATEPTQPPEHPVEFTKDVRLASLYPTEDERALQGHGVLRYEDPSDQPNTDLAENYNEDPSDTESPFPNFGGGHSAVGLGGGAGGGGATSGRIVRRRMSGAAGKPVSSPSPGWLTTHQNKEGYWSAEAHDADSQRTGATRTQNVEFIGVGDEKGDIGNSDSDLFVTALALLSYAKAGHDHKIGSKAATCRQALLYLRKVQGNDGSFRSGTELDLRTHAVVTMAVAEMYGLSGDAVLRPIVDKAIALILACQLKDSGWGSGDADLLTTTWCLQALYTVDLAGLTVDSKASYKDAQKFLDQLLFEEGGSLRVRHSLLIEKTPRPEGARKAAALPLEEAMWILSSLYCGGRSTAHKEVATLTQVLAEKQNLPVWESGKLDFLYWYMATRALFTSGSEHWDTWNKQLHETLTSHQRGHHQLDTAAGLTDPGKLDEHGSWDAVDIWSPLHGRVWSTAINGMALEWYFRHVLLESGKHMSSDADKDALADAADIANAQQRNEDTCGLQARFGGAVVGEFPLRHTDVKAKVSGTLAGTTVTQTFTNPYDRVIEAIYTFPLPGNSAINHFVMEIEGRRIIGIVKPKAEAVAAYREAKARGYTASLMTQRRPNVFTQNVANIAVGGEVEVTITYYQSLKYDQGRYEYVFPLTLGERYRMSSGGRHFEVPALPEPNAKGHDFDRDDGDGLDDTEDFDVPTLPQGMRSGMDVDLLVEIESALPIDMSSLTSVAHRAGIGATSDGRVMVQLEKADAVPNRDFVLRWSIAGEAPGVGLLTHRDERGGYLDLQFQPQLDPRDMDITPRELTFILDVSGSMSGAPSQMSRELIRRVLDHLHPDDTFNIVKFAGTNARLFDAPQANTPANIQAAKDFLNQATAGGGTEMLAGLQSALDAEHDERYLQIYAFLTDGEVYQDAEILSTIDQQGQDARFFSFGTGSSVNRNLIDGIASHGKGKAIYCLPRDGNYAEGAVNEFFSAIDMPLLCDISIDWNGLEVSNACPAQVHDLFAAQPLHVQARFSGSGTHKIYVRGRVGARHVTYPVKIDLDAKAYNPAIAAIWARAHIAELNRQLLAGWTPELEQRITDTALEYNLVSRYTSFIAIDSSRVVGDGRPMTVLQPVEMPENLVLAGDARPGTSRSFDVEGWGMTVGETSDGRVIVLQVKDGGAAAEAGMKAGQILERINGAQVTSLDRLEELLLQAKAKIDLETSLTDEGKRYDAKFKMPELKTEKKD